MSPKLKRSLRCLSFPLSLIVLGLACNSFVEYYADNMLVGFGLFLLAFAAGFVWHVVFDYDE